MEKIELCEILEVKLNIKEKKMEYQFRNWTKSLVRIEAISCFPCHVQISLNKSINTITDNGNFTIKINIPGLTAELATSRSKSYSYGLFWKNNFKRCSIFLAFDSEFHCEDHIKWLKNSINILEKYQKECTDNMKITNSLPKKKIQSSIKNMFSIYDRQHSRGIESTINLRPLPQLPMDIPNNENWSKRRVSNVSEIYEEILEPDSLNNVNLERGSHRSSTSSGIYVKMYSPKIDISAFMTPPPLPPRQRCQQNEELLKNNGSPPQMQYQQQEQNNKQRSYTNPDTEMFSSKKRTIFDTLIFRRRKRSDSCGAEATVNFISNNKNSNKKPLKTKSTIFTTPKNPSTSTSIPATIATTTISTLTKTKRKVFGVGLGCKPKLLDFNLVDNNRNSFSSSDIPSIHEYDNIKIKNINNSYNNRSHKSDDNDLSWNTESLHNICKAKSNSLDLLTLNNSKNFKDDDFFNRNSNYSSEYESLNFYQQHCRRSNQNISEHIQSTYNISSNNLSTINLVGSNLLSNNDNNKEDSSIVMKTNNRFTQIMEDSSGYCIMKPVKPKMTELNGVQLLHSTFIKNIDIDTNNMCITNNNTAVSCTSKIINSSAKSNSKNTDITKLITFHREYDNNLNLNDNNNNNILDIVNLSKTNCDDLDCTKSNDNIQSNIIINNNINIVPTHLIDFDNSRSSHSDTEELTVKPFCQNNQTKLKNNNSQFNYNDNTILKPKSTKYIKNTKNCNIKPVQRNGDSNSSNSNTDSIATIENTSINLNDMSLLSSTSLTSSTSSTSSSSSLLTTSSALEIKQNAYSVGKPEMSLSTSTSYFPSSFEKSTLLSKPKSSVLSPVSSSSVSPSTSLPLSLSSSLLLLSSSSNLSPQETSNMTFVTLNSIEQESVNFLDFNDIVQINKNLIPSSPSSKTSPYPCILLSTKIPTPSNSQRKLNNKNDNKRTSSFPPPPPRFRKVDFSPLKLKINNVLQRHFSADNI